MKFSVAFSVLACVLPLLRGSAGSLFFPMLSLLFTCFWFCFVRRYIPFSAVIFERSIDLIRNYPSIVLLTIVQFVAACGIGLLFGGVMLSVRGGELAPLLYVYLMFSYYWILYTINYVVYMTGAGLAARDYFLKNTDFMPQSPVWDSFKLAATKSLGSAAFAALLLAVIRTLRAVLAWQPNRQDDERGGVETVMLVQRCLALCVLAMLERIVHFMSRYALIYCSVFGVPYAEGCRRWAELSCTKFIDVLIKGDIIGMSIVMNMLVFLIGTGLVAYFAGGLLFVQKEIVGFLVGVAVLTGFVLSLVFLQPVTVMTDTLFVCFAEDPERLKATDPELFDRLEGTYKSELDKKVRFAE
jgi:hypothetical protein